MGFACAECQLKGQNNFFVAYTDGTKGLVQRMIEPRQRHSSLLTLGDKRTASPAFVKTVMAVLAC